MLSSSCACTCACAYRTRHFFTSSHSGFIVSRTRSNVSISKKNIFGSDGDGTCTSDGTGVPTGVRTGVRTHHSAAHGGKNSNIPTSIHIRTSSIIRNKAAVSLLSSTSLSATSSTTTTTISSSFFSCQSTSNYSKFRKSVLVNLKKNHNENDEQMNKSRLDDTRLAHGNSNNKNNNCNNNKDNDDAINIDVDYANTGIDIDIDTAKQTILLLAQKNKTWKRLSSIVDLTSSSTLSSSTSSSPSIARTKKHKTIADIGCDHGLLSIALAVSGRYEKVIGVDVSSRALEDGALTFYHKVLDILEHTTTTAAKDDDDYHDKIIKDCNNEIASRKKLGGSDSTNAIFGTSILPLEFRLGDGLKPLQPDEADAICIAGMGVETMLSILELSKDSRDNHNDNDNSYLNKLNCQTLYLQPPKNRPKHLMSLYRALQKNNEWMLIDERIVRIKKRWYVTCAFERIEKEYQRVNNNHNNNDNKDSSGDDGCTFRLPGHFLSTNPNDHGEFRKYREHHLTWLSDDLELKGYLSEEEILWRDKFKEN